MIVSPQCEGNTFQSPRLAVPILAHSRPAVLAHLNSYNHGLFVVVLFQTASSSDTARPLARNRYRKSGLTAESAMPMQGDASMSCFMPCHACHAAVQPLPLLSRDALLPNPTPIALTGVASMIDSLSPHLIGSHLQLCIEAGE